jgi:hypothetical protein
MAEFALTGGSQIGHPPARQIERAADRSVDADVQDWLDSHMAVQAALAHIGGGIDALRAAGEGRALTEAQRQALREGWNGGLIMPGGDRLTRLGELAYSTASQRLAVPGRQSPEIGEQEREALARQRQWQRQLVARHIAERAADFDRAQAAVEKVEALQARDIAVKNSGAPEKEKEQLSREWRQEEKAIVRELPKAVRRIAQKDLDMGR